MKRYTDFLRRVSTHDGKKIILWGAGNNGMTVARALRSAQIAVSYIVDSRSDPDRDIFPPERLLSERAEDCLVIVTPHYYPYINSIDGRLDQWGFKKDSSYLNFIPDDEIEDKDDSTYIDHLLGYSFPGEMDGFAVRGEQTSPNSFVILGNCTSLYSKRMKMWGEELDDALDRSYKGDYCVLNGACTGYSSSQQLLKLIRDVVPFQPKAVVVLSGVIDATFANVLHDHPFCTNFTKNLYGDIFSGGQGGSPLTYKGMSTLGNVLYGRELREGNWQIYIRNITMMHAVTSAFGIGFFFFFQPSLYANPYGLSSEEKRVLEAVHLNGQSDLFAMANRFYREVGARMHGVPWFYDLSTAFAGEKGGIYLDEIHYTEKGNGIIGERIVEHMRKTDLV